LNAHKGYSSDVLLDFTVACPNCHRDDRFGLVSTTKHEGTTVHTYMCMKCFLETGLQIKLMVKSKEKKVIDFEKRTRCKTG